MAQGPIDHPSYLTRQSIRLGSTTAGANGTSLLTTFPNITRVRNVAATVQTAGTSATSGNQVIIGVVGTCTQWGTTGVSTVGTATTTLGTVVLGTSAANSTGTSGDLNVTLASGAVLYCKNGTDATGVATVVIEQHVDPVGTWVGGGAGG